MLIGAVGQFYEEFSHYTNEIDKPKTQIIIAVVLYIYIYIYLEMRWPNNCAGRDIITSSHFKMKIIDFIFYF